MLLCVLTKESWGSTFALWLRCSWSSPWMIGLGGRLDGGGLEAGELKASRDAQTTLLYDASSTSTIPGGEFQLGWDCTSPSVRVASPDAGELWNGLCSIGGHLWAPGQLLAHQGLMAPGQLLAVSCSSLPNAPLWPRAGKVRPQGINPQHADFHLSRFCWSKPGCREGRLCWTRAKSPSSRCRVLLSHLMWQWRQGSI